MSSFIMITGALGGLGSALVRECAKRGYDVYLTDLPEDDGGVAAAVSKQYGVETRYRSCDLTDRDSRTHLLDMVTTEDIHFCGLMNVAGRDYEGAFLGRTRDQLLHLVQLMIEANIDMTYAILNLRSSERRFMLINVGSLAGFFPMPFKATYASSKRFILEFSKAIREEISDFGTVTALCPAGLPTTPESRNKMRAHGFWGKATMVEPDFVARKTLDAALAGKAVYVPGFLSQLLAWLGGWIPSTLVAKLVGRRWRAAQYRLSARLDGEKPREAGQD